MITKKTVIIVGAGASKDLGFPLGFDLQEEVSRLFENTRDPFYRFFRAAAIQLFPQEEARATSALEFGKDKAPLIRRALSVDNFLDMHRSNRDFVSVTKMAIAYQIALAEKNCPINASKKKPIEVIEAGSKHFVPHLLNILSRGHQPDNIASSFENLKFMVFNYDRVIERLCENWLLAQFGNDHGVVLRDSSFVHVYGSLGNYFDTSASNSFEYDGEFAFQNPQLELPIFSSRIKVFTEQIDSEIGNDISNIVHEAETLIFLGFGFEQQNMRFFKPTADSKNVFATLKGVGPTNAEDIQNNLRSLFCNDRRIGSVDGDSVTLFSQYGRPISTAVGSLP